MVKEKKAAKIEKFYGTGRRKTAIAKVWAKPGSGAFFINGRDFKNYFGGRKLLENQILKPLKVAGLVDKFDVCVAAFGGGIPSQAGAVCLGLSRALLNYNPDLKKVLRENGLLTRDSRMKERKKYGRKRARRGFQFTKR